MQMYSPRLARNVPLLIFLKSKDLYPRCSGHCLMRCQLLQGTRACFRRTRRQGGFLRVEVALHLHREREGGC